MSVREAQDMVKAFHEACGLGIGNETRPGFSNPVMRYTLIREELHEFYQAFYDNDLVEAADALADLLVVVLGSAVEFGIDLEPIFDEVMRTNMLKAGGPRREDGKLLKPEGWKPPDVVGCLNRQRERG